MNNKMLQYLLYICLFKAIEAQFFSPFSKVKYLSDKNFDKNVLNSDKVWFVKFYAPWCGASQNFAPEYERAANALDGVVKVGAVNVDENKELQRRFGISSFPTVKIFGDDKRNPDLFRGRRKAKNVVDAALYAIQKKVHFQMESVMRSFTMKGVAKLTDDNFERMVKKSSDIWFVLFRAPWCSECRIIEAAWIKAAAKLKGKVRFGHVDASVSKLTAQKYDIKKVPSSKYFLPWNKDEVFDFKTTTNALDLIDFAFDEFAKTKKRIKLQQIIDKNSFNCSTKPLCVISFLPQILDCDAECRKNYLKMLKNVTQKYNQKKWGWLWSEAGAQPSLEDALEIGGFGYPALAAVNDKKKIFSTFKGSFSQEGIHEFLQDIVENRAMAKNLKKKFKIQDISELNRENIEVEEKIVRRDENKDKNMAESEKIKKKEQKNKYKRKKMDLKKLKVSKNVEEDMLDYYGLKKEDVDKTKSQCKTQNNVNANEKEPGTKCEVSEKNKNLDLNKEMSQKKEENYKNDNYAKETDIKTEIKRNKNVARRRNDNIGEATQNRQNEQKIQKGNIMKAESINENQPERENKKNKNTENLQDTNEKCNVEKENLRNLDEINPIFSNKKLEIGIGVAQKELPEENPIFIKENMLKKK